MQFEFPQHPLEHLAGARFFSVYSAFTNLSRSFTWDGAPPTTTRTRCFNSRREPRSCHIRLIKLLLWLGAGAPRWWRIHLDTLTNYSAAFHPLHFLAVPTFASDETAYPFLRVPSSDVQPRVNSKLTSVSEIPRGGVDRRRYLGKI